MRRSSQKSSPSSDLSGNKTAKAPQRKRGRQRVEALVAAGAAVFAEGGFEAATMTEIAARAGASIGSLYQFFPTKEQLAAEIHARLLDALAEQLGGLIAQSEGATPEAVTAQLFARLVAFLDTHPVFPVLAERRSMDPAVKKRARARLRGQIEVVLGAMAPPVPKKRRAALAAVILHLIRTAALLKADDDKAIRSAALSELQAMLRSHLSETGR
jgi:AcrR family transcriptional regulator